MATRIHTPNPISRLTSDAVLRAFFERSQPPAAPVAAVAAVRSPRLSGGAAKALPRVVEFV